MHPRRSFGIAMRLALLTVCLASARPAPAQQLEKVTDEVNTGLTTRPYTEGRTFGYRVSWIAWTSPFRGTELQIGDLILAMNGHRYAAGAPGKERHQSVGQYGESRAWAAKGAKDGDPVTLHVLRNGREFAVVGKLRAERLFSDHEGRRALAPGGPWALERDGHGSTWSEWDEKWVKHCVTVLDYGWARRSFNNRRLLAKHLAMKDRIDELDGRYASPYATAREKEWERVRVCLEGNRYEIAPKELEWRQRQARLTEAIARRGQAAQKAMLANLAKRARDPFPAPPAVEGDLEAEAGKIVVFEKVTPRHIVHDTGSTYFVFGDRRRGYYFIHGHGDEVRRYYDAFYRYQRRVQPRIRERHTFVARIQAAPKMLVINKKTAICGVMCTLVAGSSDGKFFVDLSQHEDDVAPFEGERELLGSQLSIADDASPKKVMETFVEAVKLGDDQTYQKLFATWHVSFFWGNRLVYDDDRRFRSDLVDRMFTQARRLLADKVCDVRVVGVSPPYEVEECRKQGGPRIEECRLTVDHVGEFGGEYRAFCDVNVNRIWTLQRRNGGPWRIVNRNDI